MTDETIVYLENFCRTCMNGDEEHDKVNEVKKWKGISIFNKTLTVEFRNLTVMELLMLTTPQLNIDSGDKLPKIVCESCLESLLSAYKFQKMCIRVEKKLREMIKVEDPLKDISIENVAVSHDISDLKNIKTELDELLIDTNETGFCNKNLADNSDVIKFETDDIRWRENLHSDEYNDSDSECESLFNKLKRKKRIKAVPEKVGKAIESSSNRKEDENSTVMKNESKLNSTCKSLIRHKRAHLRNVDVREDDGRIGLIEIAKTNAELSSSVKDVEDTKFVCDECGNSLASLKNLKRHKTIHLRPVDIDIKKSLAKAKHECQICKKVYQKSVSLKHHLRTHTDEHPYLCSECGKAFKSLGNLNQHFLRHGTDRPYACPDCPKRFPCASDLSSHKLIHNKIKSHVCDICGAAFVQPYLLKKHKMYHNGVKNHKCDYCEMRFVLADHCRRHMRTHTGEKPYKCKYCERAFAQSNDLIKHLRGHLGDNVYKCDLCPQGFRLQMDLRAHFTTHKNDDEETKVRNLEALKEEEHRLQMKIGVENCS